MKGVPRNPIVNKKTLIFDVSCNFLASRCLIWANFWFAPRFYDYTEGQVWVLGYFDFQARIWTSKSNFSPKTEKMGKKRHLTSPYGLKNENIPKPILGPLETHKILVQTIKLAQMIHLGAQKNTENGHFWAFLGKKGDF